MVDLNHCNNSKAHRHKANKRSWNAHLGGGGGRWCRSQGWQRLLGARRHAVLLHHHTLRWHLRNSVAWRRQHTTSTVHRHTSTYNSPAHSNLANGAARATLLPPSLR